MANQNQVSKVTRFKKLKNGQWGITTPLPAPLEGSIVQVTKKDGSKTNVIVGKVIWKGNGIAICSLRAKERDGDGGPRGKRRCYMCGSYYCDGARGGLCSED